METEEITRVLDAIQSPVSPYEPVYTEGGDALYVMDQIVENRKTPLDVAEEIHISQAQLSRLEKSALNTMKNHLA